MAKRIAVTPRAIYHYEEGTRQPRRNIIAKYRAVSCGQVTADDFGLPFVPTNESTASGQEDARAGP